MADCSPKAKLGELSKGMCRHLGLSHAMRMRTEVAGNRVLRPSRDPAYAE